MSTLRRIHSSPECTIYQGNAVDWSGPEQIDIVITNPYGALPPSLLHHPMVIHQWIHRKLIAERWCGSALTRCVGTWNDSREAFWVNEHVNELIEIDIAQYRPEPGGWYPEELADKIVAHYAHPGQTVWDGFMGRGTIARICRERNINYVGVEQLGSHIALALDYLEIDK